ncbi:SLBB domain-containing protein [Roseomonas sp. NAR14]|uniref:SLBB domain-containing protein n=1 Tax=Roseomonas acroporae TaxID=2937791 RepID=A0A9X2BWS6_9PROT|nr:SLBB domain-containing protein [Roseomonas acroporae]MCK8787962.1 SLBB domain-containing protein [Roseomonas acroporae]
MGHALPDLPPAVPPAFPPRRTRPRLRVGTLLRLVLCAALLPPPPAALAQAGGGGSPYLLPPSLPSTLPGGGALPGLSPGTQQDILQRILDAAAGRAMPGVAQALPPAAAPAATGAPFPAPASPPAPPVPEPPLSNTESFFAARLDAPLRQFGYDSFAAPPGTAAVGMSFGALPDDYVVGRDDEVVLAFRGRSRQTLSLRVSRDGTLLLPDLAPVPAAGRTLRELRADLEARAARDLGGSEVFVSIGQIRQMSVFVGGEVARPGYVPLTALASVLDALIAAGGVKRTGSLRAVRVGGPRGTRTVDLYGVIAGTGGAADLSLREGERILVPPLGGVAAVGGDVTRPAIYELPAGAAAIRLDALLALAGQPLRPAGNRFLLQSNDAQGRRAYAEIGPGAAVRRGDVVLVQPGTDVVSNQLRLAGHVTVPLTRAAAGRGATLRGLLADPRLVRADPYPRLAAIYRTDRATRARRFVPFDLGRLLQGGGDMALEEGDEVVILALADVQWLASTPVQTALRGQLPDPVVPPAPAGPVPAFATLPGASAAAAPGAAPGTLPGLPGAAPVVVPGVAPGLPGPPAQPDCPALTQLAIAARQSPLRFAHARGAGFPNLGNPPCPQVFRDYPDLLPYLLDQSVLIAGEVRRAGLYPVVNGTGLDQALAAAGDALETADLSAVEFAREPTEGAGAIPLQRTLLDLRSRNFAAVRLSPRDAVRMPRGFGDRDTGSVTVQGEVLRPGTYDIRRGERLSELLARAGGLTPQAYPYGAVFTRDSVQQRQQEGFERVARQLESNLTAVATGQALAGVGGQAGAAAGSVAGAVEAGRSLAVSIRQARAAGRRWFRQQPQISADFCLALCSVPYSIP